MLSPRSCWSECFFAWNRLFALVGAMFCELFFWLLALELELWITFPLEGSGLTDRYHFWRDPGTWLWWWCPPVCPWVDVWPWWLALPCWIIVVPGLWCPWTALWELSRVKLFWLWYWPWSPRAGPWPDVPWTKVEFAVELCWWVLLGFRLLLEVIRPCFLTTGGSSRFELIEFCLILLVFVWWWLLWLVLVAVTEVLLLGLFGCRGFLV